MIKKLKYLYFLNLESKLQSKHILNKKTGNLIDIVTIAFNNVKTIDYQIKLLKKNLAEPYEHIIADNSTDVTTKQSIFDLCEKYGVMYVSIPKNRYKLNNSHSSAIHWTYKNILRKRDSKYFGFIDHDIFPLKPCTIVDRFCNGIYGRVNPVYAKQGSADLVAINQSYWSLWAGFFFIEAEKLSIFNPYKIDFRVKVLPNGDFLDTGGGLWDSLLKDIPYPGELAKFSSVRFRETLNGNAHTDFYERLDEWLHIGNLSNWYNTTNLQEKNNYFDLLLEKALL